MKRVQGFSVLRVFSLLFFFLLVGLTIPQHSILYSLSQMFERPINLELSVANAETKAPTIKVALLGARTGRYSFYGEALPGAQWVFEQINAAGGIKGMNGAKVEWIYADTRSDTNVVPRELERLVHGEKVDAIIFASPTSEIYAGATVYDRLKIPVITTIATSEPLFELNLKYWRMLSVPSSEYGLSIVKWLEDLMAEYKVKHDKIGLVTGDAPWLLVYRDYELKRLKELGLDKNIVLDIQYSTKTTDLTPTVLKIKAAAPDLIIVNDSASTMSTLWKAVHDVEYAPPLVLYGLTSISYPVAWRDMGEALMMEQIASRPVFAGAVGHEAVPYEPFQKLRKSLLPWVEKNGWTFNDYFYINAQAAYALWKVWEKLGTKDTEKVNDALTALEIPEGDPFLVNPLFLPALKWLPNGKVANAILPMAQWQGKNLQLIYPKKWRTAEPKLK